jgi:glycosyltransferase involved in cell wall biosynthesis
MKVALVYDRVNKWGGAERVLLALHELFPDAPLFTSVYNQKTAGWAEEFHIKTSFLQHMPYASSSHEYYPLLMPTAFESFHFDAYDLVISVSSEAAKGIITGPNTVHICYCLTPTRYLWSGFTEYFHNAFFRFISKPFIFYLRFWDLVASSRPDAYIAISQEVKKRIKTYYNKEALVIYPPVLLADREQKNIGEKSGDYFLIVSRLVGYKHIELAIQACNDLRLPLKIIGVGSEERKLRKISGPTIEFLGLLTEDRLIKYYKSCKALIFPGLEDFGITMVEAQAFGKPVIAFKGGGALETVKNQKTGVFFTPQNRESLKKVLQDFDKKTFFPKDCIENAKKFSQEQFKRNFVATIEHIVEEKRARL